jgi:hypothetical protein
MHHKEGTIKIQEKEEAEWVKDNPIAEIAWLTDLKISKKWNKTREIHLLEIFKSKQIKNNNYKINKQFPVEVMKK